MRVNRINGHLRRILIRLTKLIKVVNNIINVTN